MSAEAPQPSPESERPPEWGPVFEYPSEADSGIEKGSDQDNTTTPERSTATPAFLDNWPVAVL